MIGHVSSVFPGAQDHRTRSSTVNKSPSESMSFITEVICKFIFTDVHMRNNYRPIRAKDEVLKVIAYLDSSGQTTKNEVKNLGVILETDLSFSSHVKAVTKSAYYNLKKHCKN